jgi:sortase A
VPGEKGNAFVFGHSSNFPWVRGNFNDVFALLDNVTYGDEIIVFYNQKKFVYIVREKKIVKPGDVKALERDPNKTEISLMTCWPIGTTLKRMLVFAELTETP